MNLRPEKADPEETTEEAVQTAETVVNEDNDDKGDNGNQGGNGNKGGEGKGGAAYGGLVIDSWRMPVFWGSFSWETFW